MPNPPATRKPDRVADGTGFTYDTRLNAWTCQICAASVGNYLRHGKWHARLTAAIRKIAAAEDFTAFLPEEAGET